jgi:hypothetical protein
MWKWAANHWPSFGETAFALRLAFVIVSSSNGASAKLPPPAVPTKCDRLAGNPADRDLPKDFPAVGKGDEINPDTAIPACRQALKATPGDRRVRFQTGRALQSGKKFEKARLENEQAASEGAASAMKALAANGGPKTSNIAIVAHSGSSAGRVSQKSPFFQHKSLAPYEGRIAVVC